MKTTLTLITVLSGILLVGCAAEEDTIPGNGDLADTGAVLNLTPDFSTGQFYFECQEVSCDVQINYSFEFLGSEDVPGLENQLIFVSKLKTRSSMDRITSVNDEIYYTAGMDGPSLPYLSVGSGQYMVDLEMQPILDGAHVRVNYIVAPSLKDDWSNQGADCTLDTDVCEYNYFCVNDLEVADGMEYTCLGGCRFDDQCESGLCDNSNCVTPM